MFSGYYLRIDGVTYPTEYMVIPTYSLDDAPIVVNDYYDASYERHIIKAPKNNITITFNIRQLFNTEFPAAIAPFTDTMQIEFYDAKIDDYRTGTFTYMGNLNPQNSGQYDGRLVFNELKITLVRKADET